MADVKISESQRKYFAKRINEEFNAQIRLIRQQEAKQVSDLSENNFEAYLEAIDMTNIVESFRKAEVKFENAKKKINTIITNLEQADPSDETSIKRYDCGYGTVSTIYNYDGVQKYFTMKCNQVATDEFRKKDKTIKTLEDKKNQAIDFVYGLTKHSELYNGMKTILKGTDIKLQLGGGTINEKS